MVGGFVVGDAAAGVLDEPGTCDDGTYCDDQDGDEAAGLAGVGAEPFVVAVDGCASGD